MPPPPPQPPSPPPPSSQRPRRAALVADPDQERGRRLAALLASLDLDAEHVRSGDAAATRLVNKSYALVVTELSLTGLDGFALVEQLRKRHAADVTRVIAMSAFVALRTAASERSAALGIAAVLAADSSADAFVRAARRSLAPPPSKAPLASKAPPRTRTPAAVRNEAREEARLAAVRDAGVDDGDVDPELDRLVRDAAASFGVSAAFISFVLEDRQWFKAAYGVGGRLLRDRGSPRDISFCRHVVEADRPAPLLVPDAAIHPVFAQNPLVKDGSVRSYAGAPLIDSGGHVLGTLCLVDTRVATLGPADVDKLVILARAVAGHLELRAAERAAATTAPPAAVAPAAVYPAAGRATPAPTPVAAAATTAAAAAVDQRIRALHAGYAAVLDGVDAAVILMTGPERSIRIANAAVGSFFGLEPRALLGMPRAQFVEAAARCALDPDAFIRALNAPAVGAFAGSAVVETARPARRVVRWRARPVIIEGERHQLATFTDITAEADLAAARERESLIDPLTGLVNRRGFQVELERERARRAREGTALAVLALDIDHFKRVNDTHGHAAGDAVLTAVANAVRASVRAVDVPARMGGEEITVLLVGADAGGAADSAERIRAAVEALALPSGPVTLSAGVAVVDGDDPAEALARADARLYEAKKRGRNRVVAADA